MKTSWPSGWQDSRLLLSGGMLAGGLIALAFGLTYEWDMRNYHLYNPHALLTGRLAIDVAPAGLQTFLNPLFHVPSYVAFRYLDPAVWVFLSGALQGAQLFLLWRLLPLLTGQRPVPWMFLIVAVLGLCGPIFISELGGTYGDAVLSVLVLWALLQVLGGQGSGEHESSARGALVGGLLLGLATALKLTFATYAIGLGVALLLCGNGANRWSPAFTYGGGAALGFLLGGGAWFAHLWIDYQNPFFPYFNQIFDSPWAGESNYRDLRFIPLSIVDWLAYPFVWLMDPHRVWELQFRDLRMVALYPAVIAFLFLGWKRARRDSPRLLFVCVFLAVSYVIWLHMFSIYRYLSVVEILAPGVIVALAMFMRCPRRWLAVLVLLLICSQFLIEFPRSPRALHLEPGQTSTLSTLPEGSMVVMDGYEPIAFALLWLDDDIPAVRIRSNLLIKDPPEDGLNLEARRRAREHAGPVFLLHARSELIAPFLEQDLAGVGLHLNRPDDCQPVFMETALQDETGLLLCPLIRQNALPVQLVR